MVESFSVVTMLRSPHNMTGFPNVSRKWLQWSDRWASKSCLRASLAACASLESFLSGHAEHGVYTWISVCVSKMAVRTLPSGSGSLQWSQPGRTRDGFLFEKIAVPNRPCFSGMVQGCHERKEYPSDSRSRCKPVHFSSFLKLALISPTHRTSGLCFARNFRRWPLR